jgi:hypothetical protein
MSALRRVRCRRFLPSSGKHRLLGQAPPLAWEQNLVAFLAAMPGSFSNIGDATDHLHAAGQETVESTDPEIGFIFSLNSSCRYSALSSSRSLVCSAFYCDVAVTGHSPGADGRKRFGLLLRKPDATHVRISPLVSLRCRRQQYTWPSSVRFTALSLPPRKAFLRHAK